MRAHEIIKDWTGEIADRVVLDYEGRHRRRIALTTERGVGFLLDLPDVPDLRDGDALRLTSGEVIAVSAAPEALMEIRCRDALHLARMAWHIGNRHLAAEIGEGFLRIRADHVIAEMVKGLGGKLEMLEAPFNPEGGAYGAHIPVSGHDHGHSHHEHGHSHG
ncbi:urease accessory protein [Parvibaculum indicum]|uniref:urease accessory protein UreE n=1 Tax=Parvibaculum indicum TaxID=562969 RepID=UPI00141DCA46|nr:urease accessory protein UreE [Parvibaculum indicum]NIJ41964.1 urease accessory protein [Parvibaculum indicum]